MQAEKPIAYVGGGILLANASDELKAFVEHLSLPVAHSLMGKGAIPDNHQLLMGMSGFWGTELVNRNCLNADVIFAIGTRFKEADCSSWYSGYTFNIPDSKIIHIDIEASEIGRNYPTEIGVISDAKQALKLLLEIAKKKCPNGLKRDAKIEEISTFKKQFKQANQKMEQSNAFPMMPELSLIHI